MLEDYDKLVKEFSWNIPEAYNLGMAVSRPKAAHRAATAIVVADEFGNDHYFSFANLDQLSSRMANLLVSKGCQKGDRVAIMLGPSLEAAISIIAALKAGMVAMPLSASSPTGHAEQLEKAEARAILAGSAEAEQHGARWSKLGSLETIEVVCPDQSNAIPGEWLGRKLAKYRAEFEAPLTNIRDPAILSFTSGSEGKPKGVVHGHSAVLGMLPTLVFTKLPTTRDLVWSHFEWSSLGGLLIPLSAWHCGAAVLIGPSRYGVSKQTIEMLCRTGATRASFSPTALRMLQRSVRSTRFPALNSITTGGEKLDPELRGWVRTVFGSELCELYGLSECAGVMGSGHLVPSVAGAIGRASPGMDLAIIGEDGSIRAQGDVGELAIRSPHPAMFQGYWKDDAATKARFSGPFLKTGDLAFQDVEGYFHFVSRADDVIKSGGRRIGPAEIENAFVAHPSVRLCAAAGVPDAVSGEAIVLWVQLDPTVDATIGIEEQIMATARKTLENHQVPVRLRFVSDIPTTNTGKVHRKAVRDAEMARGKEPDRH